MQSECSSIASLLQCIALHLRRSRLFDFQPSGKEEEATVSYITPPARSPVHLQSLSCGSGTHFKRQIAAQLTVRSLAIFLRHTVRRFKKGTLRWGLRNPQWL